MSITTGQSVQIRVLPKDNDLINLGVSFGKHGKSASTPDRQNRSYPRVQARSKDYEYYWCTVNDTPPRNEILYTPKNFKLENVTTYFTQEYIHKISSSDISDDDVYVLFKSYEDFDESTFFNKKYIILKLRGISSTIIEDSSDIKVQIVDGKPSIVIHCYINKDEFYKDIDDVYDICPVLQKSSNRDFSNDVKA